MRTRPDVVISTGAAPGLFGILFGRLVGARTIWIDSIANAEKLSLSGRIASRIAHIALTQWPHLAATRRPSYRGSIL
jgi:UDP-N-acetylglucosamine:LPS N-acetylglucosamine transferase